MSVVLEESWLWPTVALAFVWGSLWGSFLNVVIWRLPRGQSLVHPPSHCPACNASIRPWDNVPILAWLWLRGRCRDCGVSISWRYPAVEALCALLHAGLWYHIASPRIAVEPWTVLAIPFLLLGTFMLVCVAIALIDLDLTIIPHELTLPTIVLGLVAALLIPKTGTFEVFFPSVDLVDSVIGLVAGAGILFLVFQGYQLVTGRVGLGGGDFTTVGMIGAFLGWQSLLFVLMAASVQGVLAALVAASIDPRRQREQGGEGFLLEGAHREAFWRESGESNAEAPGQALGDGVEHEEEAGPQIDAAGDGLVEPVAAGDGSGESDGEGGEGAASETTSSTEEDGASEGEDRFLQLAIPFGPFLTLAAIQYIFVGEYFWRWLLAGNLP